MPPTDLPSPDSPGSNLGRRDMLLPLASAALAPWLGWNTEGRAESDADADAAASPGGKDGGSKEGAEGRVEIVLLHDNDQHFHYNHADAFRRAVRHVRETRRNVIHLNGGDIVVRHPQRWAESESLEYYERMASFVIDEMNKTGYDAMVLGNHEIDYREDITLRQLRRARFPILGANVVSETPRFLTPERSQRFETAEGLAINVLGLSTGSAEGVTVRDRRETLREHLHLREECDLFVLLTHIGYRADRQIADEFPEVDLIVGGHSHTLLPDAESSNGVGIAQAGGFPHVLGGQLYPERPAQLGVVQIVFENRKPVLKHGRVFAVDSENDAKVRSEIDTWLDRSLTKIASTDTPDSASASRPLLV